MHTAGVSPLSVLWSLAALSWVAPAESLASEDTRRAIQRDLPRYDPAAYEKAAAEKAARTAPRNTPAPIPESPATTPSAVATTASKNVLELPKVTVRPDYDPPRHLPRIESYKPPGPNPPADPFESAAGRQDRLMKKHLSSLERALARIPLIGGGIIGSAYEAEAREQKAAQMNELADGIEIQAILGRDPEEIKKLRAEYLKLYYSGPKK